jgi:hypothetical protein
MSDQYNWFWCNKCNGLVYGGDPYSYLFEVAMGNIGVCPAGGTHYLGASSDYSVSYGEASTSTLQADWYWCQKCQGIWWYGNPSVASHCPAGGQHDHTSSYNYDILHSIPLTSGQQNNWRWCNKCQGLFYAANSSLGPGLCPDGGTHNDGGSEDYHLVIPAVTKPLAPGDVVPKNDATGVSTDPYFSWSDPGAGHTGASRVRILDRLSGRRHRRSGYQPGPSAGHDYLSRAQVVFNAAVGGRKPRGLVYQRGWIRASIQHEFQRYLID